MKFLTNLLFEPKGKHDPALAYTIKDTVMSADGSKVYFALQDVPAGTPLTDEDFWKLQIDLSSSKSAMDEAIASFGSYAKVIGTRVKGETAKTSGNPVTFLPDAGSLIQPVTVLEPQQQGSGDPYPAGGSKNLLPITAKTQTINGVTFTVDNGVITANGTATANAYLWLCDEFTLQPGTYVMSGIPENFDYNTQGGFTDDNWSINRYGVTTLTEAKKVKPYVVIRNGVTANNVVFKLQLEAGSVATAFMPYSNIRPFIGYDKLDLNAVGKNLANLTYRASVPSINNGLDVTANGWASDYVYIGSNNVVLSVSDVVEGEAFFLFLYDENEAFIGYNGTESINSTAIWSTTIPGHENARYCRLRLSADANTASRLQLELTPDPTTYEPYHGKLHTVQIGETVYGGKLDWLMGKLVAEWAVYTVTGEEQLNVFPDNPGTCNRFGVILPEALTDNTETLCSHFHLDTVRDWAYSASDVDAYYGVYRITSGYVRFILPAKTLSEAQTLLAAQNAAGTPVQIAYKLKTPIEIQLSPTIISAADPEQANTLYGDGVIEVEYVKPLHVSIEEHVAAALAAAKE